MSKLSMSTHLICADLFHFFPAAPLHWAVEAANLYNVRIFIRRGYFCFLPLGRLRLTLQLDLLVQAGADIFYLMFLLL